MTLKNKRGITDSAELARMEEKISKERALKLFETGRLDEFGAGTFAELAKKALKKVVDWNIVDKGDYLLAMERSPVKDTEIKALLKAALTKKINDRTVYMKGIDASYFYEGYSAFKAEALKNK